MTITNAIAKMSGIILGVMTEGQEKHPDDDWENQTREYHVQKAWIHFMMYSEGDTTEPHLSHAFTRLGMALLVGED